MAVQKNFVVKNGLEVNTNLIFADTNSNKVGIATTNTNYTLDVNGTIGTKNSIVSGASTFNNVTINGRITAGSSLGASGQYLVSTGTGVTWATVPKIRTVDTRTATAGQTTFSVTYTVGLIDVYINGVRLSDDEFTANDTATVILDDPCFGGETVEFILYSPFSVGIAGSSIEGISILEEGVVTGTPLKVTSINFVGASVTAVGSGLGVTVYLSDYVASAGISTVSQGLTGTPNIQVGIITATNVVIGGGTTQLLVNGDARITGILTIGTSSITLNGSSNTINVGSGVTINGSAGTISATSINIGGQTLAGVGVTSITAGSGISVDQSTGNVTITATGGGVSSQWETTGVGIHTLSNVGIGTTNPTSKLTVKGTSALENVTVSGISTLGIVTGATYYGDTSNAVDGRWTLGANGTSDYTFTGIGFTQTTNDPVLYLARGRVYEFVNNSGGSHPFEIRLSAGGVAYNDGVTNNASATGVIRFEVSFNAPNTLYYQCTNHSGMGNTISVYPTSI